MACYFQFKILPEYFVDYFEVAKQSLGHKVTTQPNLGLIYQPSTKPEKYESIENFRMLWEEFASRVNCLNAESPDHIMYKVLYLTRYGLGVHNIYEAEVGRGPGI